MKGILRFIGAALALCFVACGEPEPIVTPDTTIASLGTPADNEIWFTTYDKRPLMAINEGAFDSEIVNIEYSEYGANIITFADRITFMEMTLYKMDSSVRGHKQLSKSIKQMKDNLLANGYELVDMLGKDYHDGMKVTANFVEDENLPEGKQIIIGIIKPQINYQGKMIQSAQITVSQNL